MDDSHLPTWDRIGPLLYVQYDIIVYVITRYSLYQMIWYKLVVTFQFQIFESENIQNDLLNLKWTV